MSRDDDLQHDGLQHAEIEHGDIEAALAARRELGARYDAELVDGFAERIERVVQRRVDEQLAVRQGGSRREEGARMRQFVLALVSVGVGVPITIVPTVAPDDPSLTAVVAAWLGIVGVNVAHARQSRR